MAGYEYQSAGQILAPWMKKMNEGRQRMENEGQAGGTLPGMEGGGAPIGEENSTRVIGRLTRKPLTVEVTGGHKKAIFTLAVTRSYRDGENRPKQQKAFVPVVAWRALAAQVETLGKDSAVLIEGHLRTWSDPKGKNFRWEVEAEVLEVLERRESPSDERAPRPEASAA
ncbi:MAG: single-stranded DNA-binding protein [Elusimicrobiota bacterium]|nr:MAG: single-stranded DNA-binding protein [Elusimicrobiota bacterium]